MDNNKWSEYDNALKYADGVVLIDRKMKLQECQFNNFFECEANAIGESLIKYHIFKDKLQKYKKIFEKNCKK